MRMHACDSSHIIDRRVWFTYTLHALFFHSVGWTFTLFYTHILIADNLNIFDSPHPRALREIDLQYIQEAILYLYYSTHYSLRFSLILWSLTLLSPPFPVFESCCFACWKWESDQWIEERQTRNRLAFPTSSKSTWPSDLLLEMTMASLSLC